jgi:hypothetical protein
MHFGNILVIASTAVLAVAAPSTGLKKRVKTFQFFGVNESGAEFGNTAHVRVLHFVLMRKQYLTSLQLNDRYPRWQGLEYLP